MQGNCICHCKTKDIHSATEKLKIFHRESAQKNVTPEA